MVHKVIFGFGSLINRESLKATVSDAYDIKPCFIKGFVRDFSLWDSVGFTETNLNLKATPFCALDVKKVNDVSKIVNGVMFKTSETHFNDLLRREQGYDLIETEVYDFKTGNPLGSAFLFSANKNNGKYNFGCKAQERYLSVCLSGAKAFGEKFYSEFLDTTFIENRCLSEVLELQLLL